MTARKLADNYLNSLKKKLQRDELSRGYYDLMKRSVDVFVEFYGPHQSLEQLTTTHIRQFAEHLTDMVQKEEIGKTTASNYQSRVRTFISHIAEDYPQIPLPKNLRSKTNVIYPDTPNPVALTLDEAKVILSNAHDRTKLYLLLALNCGMLQSDLTDFQADEIDWKARRVIRCRTKGKRLAESKGNKPPGRCNWYIWRDTWELLKAYARKMGNVFLQDNGNLLVTKTHSDNIARLYENLIAELKTKSLLPNLDFGPSKEADSWKLVKHKEPPCG